MSDQKIESNLLEELSTEEQEVLTGGHRWGGYRPWGRPVARRGFRHGYRPWRRYGW
jgi:hypothetical protein